MVEAERSEVVTDDSPEQAATRALVAQVVAGDVAAVTSLVARHHAAMTYVAAAILGNPANAADVVQDAWIRILASLSNFECRSSLKTWILRITANVARTTANMQRREEPRLACDDPTSNEATVDPARFMAAGVLWRDPPRHWSDGEQEVALLEHEARAIVRREIDALPPNQRAVVRLRDVEELSSEDVCEVLQISEANQRVLLHRGRAKLRAAIARELGRP